MTWRSRRCRSPSVRRYAGVSKATMRQGVLFLRQLAALRRLARRGVPAKVGGQPPSTTSS